MQVTRFRRPSSSPCGERRRLRAQNKAIIRFFNEERNKNPIPYSYDLDASKTRGKLIILHSIEIETFNKKL
jgi:hypothetical protein